MVCIYGEDVLPDISRSHSFGGLGMIRRIVVLIVLVLLVASCEPSGRHKITIDDGISETPPRTECALNYYFIESGGITWRDCYTEERVTYFKSANETITVERFE